MVILISSIWNQAEARSFEIMATGDNESVVITKTGVGSEEWEERFQEKIRS